MQGFKSFARKTELPFTPGINVILGPNGSGKSNVSDALCFVLGRLSAKSMRAAKAKNLIFMGSKVAAPAKEAVVEMVFDNVDRTFSIDEDEVSIKRVVRKNGQSIYRINNKTKTRQEVLALLAQAGIDPNGFNIVLQGGIQNFVKMHTDERRKIIEEVSGISIYEHRKERSLKELEKTENKLKEVLTVLRERTSYLNNLERERQQALKFKKLEKDVKKFRASIIYFDLTKKKKEVERVLAEIEKKNKDAEKVKVEITKFKTNISNLEGKVESINQTIQKATGLEQEKLNQEIANLRADLAGLQVKLESSERKLLELNKQKQELNNAVRELDLLVKELQKESPTIAKKEKELSQKKKELEAIEEKRKKFYMVKTELKSLRERLTDKTNLYNNYNNESNFLLKQIESMSRELFDTKTTPEKVDSLKHALASKTRNISKMSEREIELEKLISTSEYEIGRQNKIIENIAKMDVCPLCKNKITKDHIGSIKDEAGPQIEKSQKQIEEGNTELGQIKVRRETLKEELEKITIEISKRQSDLIKLTNVNEKKEQIKVLQEKIEEAKKEIAELAKRKNSLETNFDENSNIENKYENLRVEVQEISLRSEENVNSEITFKLRELERSKITLKQVFRNEEDLLEELVEVKKLLKQKQDLLEKKRTQEEVLSKKFEKLIKERDEIQGQVRTSEHQLLMKQGIIRSIEQGINNSNIDKARVNAEVENLEIEMLEFNGVEVVKTNRDSLLHQLRKTQDFLARIGSVNMRSLEVYDTIKKEYDAIKGKVEIISGEKDSILKVIHEIDIKKKKTFLTTLNALNDIFGRNFAQISTKGQVALELENKKDPFEGGVAISVKIGNGKYFDVTSLSGGEQTMVALSLIFAIQELKPYYFYILDEIDAALDKRNSERLANLLRKYMQKGQYIVITHNDEIITNAHKSLWNKYA